VEIITELHDKMGNQVNRTKTD